MVFAVLKWEVSYDARREMTILTPYKAIIKTKLLYEN